MKTSLASKLVYIVKGKCPDCGKGDVYEKNRKWIQLPKMNHQCEHCGYNFNGEPGYFLGAMYVSYAMAVFEGLVTFFIASLFMKEFSGISLALIITGVIVVFAIPNFKFSRIIWMNLFPYRK